MKTILTCFGRGSTTVGMTYLSFYWFGFDQGNKSVVNSTKQSN